MSCLVIIISEHRILPKRGYPSARPASCGEDRFAEIFATLGISELLKGQGDRIDHNVIAEMLRTESGSYIAFFPDSIPTPGLAARE